jgi:hypothetical protein
VGLVGAEAAGGARGQIEGGLDGAGAAGGLEAFEIAAGGAEDQAWLR